MAVSYWREVQLESCQLPAREIPTVQLAPLDIEQMVVEPVSLRSLPTRAAGLTHVVSPAASRRPDKYCSRCAGSRKGSG